MNMTDGCVIAGGTALNLQHRAVLCISCKRKKKTNTPVGDLFKFNKADVGKTTHCFLCNSHPEFIIFDCKRHAS